MPQFNFETIKETEKALFIKVPYYEETSNAVKTHKQLFFECWIPKYILEKGDAKSFVIGKRNERRLSNSYQRAFSKMPKSWNTLGEYAPIKTARQLETIDYDKVDELCKFYRNKYGRDLRALIIDGEGKDGMEVTDEDYNVIVQLEFPKLTKPDVPKKQITVYD